MIKVVILGSGNVAQHLIEVMKNAPTIDLVQVFARNPNQLNQLLPSSKIVSDYQKIAAADVYIISVSDNAITEVSGKLPFENRLVVHTSGSSDLSVLDNKNRKGVFYPLQTFTKGKDIDFTPIPICLEAENEADYELLEKLGNCISQKVVHISSEQRKSLHVAAVFVSNFVNHMYVIGCEICATNNVPFEVLQPLIQEVANKINFLSPKEAQTGPALRNDTKTIEKHIEFLKNNTSSEGNMFYLSTFYNAIGMHEEAENTTELLLKKFPKGNHAKNDFFEKYYQEPNKTENFIRNKQKEYLSIFDDSTEDDLITFQFGLLEIYLKEKNLEKIAAIENYPVYKNKIANIYNSHAWTLSGEDLTHPGTDLDFAERLSKKTLEIVKYQMENPDYESFSIRLSGNYNMFADTYALILYKQKREILTSFFFIII